MQVHRHGTVYHQGKEGGALVKDRDEANRQDAEDAARKAREAAESKAARKRMVVVPTTFKLDVPRAPIKPVIRKE